MYSFYRRYLSEKWHAHSSIWLIDITLKWKRFRDPTVIASLAFFTRLSHVQMNISKFCYMNCISLNKNTQSKHSPCSYVTTAIYKVTLRVSFVYFQRRKRKPSNQRCSPFNVTPTKIKTKMHTGCNCVPSFFIR